MFGLAIASADIDRDGYEDLVVGSQVYDPGRGRLYLFSGGKSMDTVADVIFQGEDYPDGESGTKYGQLTLKATSNNEFWEAEFESTVTF